MEISERTRDKSRKDPSRVEPLRAGAASEAGYVMRLFVAGDEPNSVTARRNLDGICSAHLAGNFKLEVIDVFTDFAAAIQENVLVTPTLIVDRPKRVRIFGNLQDTDKVLSALDLV
jgi:circadian clock protein KaiB